MPGRNPVLVAFGNRVRAHRHAIGWSQERLHDECGIHWSYLGQVERGQRNVGVLNVHRIAMALGVSPAQLVDD